MAIHVTEDVAAAFTDFVVDRTQTRTTRSIACHTCHTVVGYPELRAFGTTARYILY